MTSQPMTRTAARSLSLVLTLVMIGAGPTIVAAQSPRANSQRTPITVALVNTLPLSAASYDAVVLRMRANGRDVILLPRATASGQLLDDATRSLLQERAMNLGHPNEHHGKPYKVLTMGVRARNSRMRGDGRAVVLAQRIVDRLKGNTAPVLEIPGVGRVPALEFIPPKAQPQTAHGM